MEELNQYTFQEKVLDAGGKVMVMFFATWCPHCHKMLPEVQQLDESEDIAPIYLVDVDKEVELTETYAPEGVPTFVLFQDGEMVDRTVGEQPIQNIADMIAEG
ncbi:MAG: thioredoxin family protein [Eggerthellaceae bacterium]|nr:thioredoxin family protein [Eggerthellaceae bacterium]